MSLRARPFSTSHFPEAVILLDSRAPRWGLIPACRREVCRRASKRVWAPGLTPFLQDRRSCRWSPPPLPAEGSEGSSCHWETRERGFALRKPRPSAPYPIHCLLQGSFSVSCPLPSAPGTGVSPFLLLACACRNRGWMWNSVCSSHPLDPDTGSWRTPKLPACEKITRGTACRRLVRV